MSDRKRILDLEARLRDAERQHRRLLKCLMRAEEEERRRIAADIHREPVQAMVAAAMRVGQMRRTAGADLPTEDLEDLEDLERTVQAALNRLQALMSDLHPPALDRDGLGIALRRHLAQRCEDAGIRYELSDDLGAEPPLETSVAAFRIVQEALDNVTRHAAAATVTVVLHAHDGGLSVRVTDDGRGFAADDGRIWLGHCGLRAMEERAELAGGRLWLRSTPGTGTTVEFWLPHTSDDSSDGRMVLPHHADRD